MDFVGDYNERRAEAEKLRRRQLLMQTMGGKLDTGPLVTPGNENFPGQVGINWGGNLAQLGHAFMNRRMDDRVAESEAAETDARNAALQQVLGQVSGQAAGAALSPQQLTQLQDLGVSPEALKHLIPKAPSAGAITQGATSLEGIAAMEATGIITKEQADRLREARTQSEQTERERYLFEQENKRFSSKQPKESEADFKLRLLKEDPDSFAKIYGDKTKAGSGGRTSNRYDPAREAVVLGNVADQLEKLITEEGDEMFGTGQTIAAGAREYGSKVGGVLGTAAEALGTKAESPANAQMRSLGVDAALESVARMAPASDTDVQLLLRNKPNAFQNKESALAFVRLMKVVSERYKNFIQSPEDLDAELDELMKE